MNTKRIASVLAILLIVAGCTVSASDQDNATSAFSSAGKENIQTEEHALSGATGQEDKLVEELIASKKTIRENQKTSAGSDEKVPAEEDKTITTSSDPSPQQSTAPVQETQQQPTAPQQETQPSTPVEQQPAETPAPDLEPVYEPEPTPEPEPPAPAKACPGGVYEDLGCEVILDTNYYYETFISYDEAMAKGQYYLDEVMYIGDIEITNYSVQAVYRNDHSVAWYGLNLWSSGSLIQ